MKVSICQLRFLKCLPGCPIDTTSLQIKNWVNHSKWQHITPVRMNRPKPGVKYVDQELIVKVLRPERAIIANFCISLSKDLYLTLPDGSLESSWSLYNVLLVLAVPNSQWHLQDNAYMP